MNLTLLSFMTAVIALASVPGLLHAAPDLAKAKRLVEQTCSICHGMQGESSSEFFPRLGGQHAAYLSKQLRDFRSGRRKGDMVLFTRRLEDDLIDGLAQYLAIQKISASPAKNPELESVARDIPVKHHLVLGAESDANLFLRKGAKPKYSVDDEARAVSINYTSGTTARPKGVQLSHRSCWLNAVTFALHVGVAERDVYLHTLPTFHANGWGMPYALTALGARALVVLCKRTVHLRAQHLRSCLCGRGLCIAKGATTHASTPAVAQIIQRT